MGRESAGDSLRDKSFPGCLSTGRRLERRLSWHREHFVDAFGEARRGFEASRLAGEGNGRLFLCAPAT